MILIVLSTLCWVTSYTYAKGWRLKENVLGVFPEVILWATFPGKVQRSEDVIKNDMYVRDLL